MHIREKNINIWTTIKLYRWKSVFFKYFRSFFILILITLIPYNVLLYNLHKYTLSNEVATYSTTNALKSKSIFDLLTSSFDMNYNLASDSDFVSDFLQSNVITKEHPTSSLVKNFVQTMTDHSDFIDELFIYSFKNNQYISSKGIYSASKGSAWPWLNTYMATKFPLVMFPRKVNSDDYNYLFICSELYDSESNVIGLFSARIKYDDFTEVVRQSFQDEPDKIFIVSNIGLILYSDDPSLINTLVFERDDIYTAFKSAESLEGNTITYDDYIISVAKSSSNRLMLMCYFSNQYLMRNFSYITQIMIACAFCVFIIAILISLFISFRQYRSVAQVMQTLEDPEKLNGKDGRLLAEFFYISNTISNISYKSRAMNDELSEKMRTLKKVQIAALQAQINPHFLFNTLQLINLSILKEVKKDTTATFLISQLAELLRSSYDTDHYVVACEQELNNVQKYLAIQKVRYKNRLQVTYEIDENCLSYETLNLLLQPFVENSIVHGFNGKENDWKISITISKSENELCYTILDNGIGMDEIQMQQLNFEMKTRNTFASHNIGIANVNQRLKLLYGNHYEIRFSNEINGGTQVIIRHVINQD